MINWPLLAALLGTGLGALITSIRMFFEVRRARTEKPPRGQGVARELESEAAALQTASAALLAMAAKVSDDETLSPDLIEEADEFAAASASLRLKSSALLEDLKRAQTA